MRRGFSWARPLLLAAVLLTAVAAGAIALSLPPEGRVVGVCRDAVTGAPLANVVIAISRNDDSDDQPTNDAGDPTNPSNNSSPQGWAQGSDDDSTVDLAGASTTPRSEWKAVTDAHGRFEISRVPTGEYSLDTTSTGHDSTEQTVAVLEGQDSRLDLSMKPSVQNLSFEEATFNWMPSENPSIALTGLLRERKVMLTLYRLDVARTSPADLSQLMSAAGRGQPLGARAPGQFTLVRQWTHSVANADAEGAFYDHLLLATDAAAPGGPQTLPAGVYEVEASGLQRDKGVSAVAWVVVTRLALVSKSYGSQVLAYVADLSSGQSVPGASVALYNQAGGTTRVLSTATSDSRGFAHLASAGVAKESEGVLIARLGPSICGLGFDLASAAGADEGDDSDTSSTLPAGSGPALRAFLYTDRPVYRPGQTAYLKGVMRLFDQKRGFVVPANRPVSIEIRDAQDTLVSKQAVTTNDMGSWSTSVALSPETLTGEYTIRAEMAGQAANATFDVAAYQKPEFQATVSFSKDRYIRGDVVHATITVAYYYGAPVVGGTASVTVLNDASADSSGGAGDDDDSGSGAPVLSKDYTLDGDGKAQVDIPTAGQPAGDADYTVNVDVQDKSGRSVSASGSVIVAQGDFSLSVAPSSVVAQKGDLLGVTVAATGARSAFLGRPASVTAQYDSWEEDGTERLLPVSKSLVVIDTDGLAHVSVRATQAGLLLLSVSATDERGNQITADSQVWVAAEQEELPEQYPDLSLVLDQAKYQPGQTAHLLINTEHPGPQALVTVEGTSLYSAFLVKLARHSTSVDIPVTAAYAPSVTVSVCCIVEKQFLSSSQSLTTQDPSLPLSVNVRADKCSYHPGDLANLTISTFDSHGHPRPAELSVGVVDSAIYAIAPEPSGTILQAMQPDQDDAVTTSNSCESTYYGDVDKGATDVDIRRRFPDTALWEPNVRTGPDGTAHVSLTLPDTLTTWRVTCVGHTSDTLVGKGVTNMEVSKDLLVRLETPPFLVAGNRSTLIAVVHDNTDNPLTARVHLTAQGLSVSGAVNADVAVFPGKPAELSWPVLAGAAGTGSATVTAVSGSLSDGVEEDLPINPHGAFASTWQSGALLRETVKQVALDPKAIRDSSILQVRLTPTMSSAILPAMDYLSSYPYGSTDSTVSALLPDLVLAGAGGAAKEQGAPALNLTSGQKARLRDEATRGLLRLYRFQRDDGGWGWFSVDQSDLWMTAYATWSLTLARDTGFPVKPNVLQAASQETANLANTERGPKDYKYADYTSLALAALALSATNDKQPALGNLRWLEKMWRSYPETQDNEDIAISALAEERLGGAETAKAQALMSQLWGISRNTGTTTSWTCDFHRSAAGVAQDMPDTEATAWCLLAAEAITPMDPRIDSVARWLIANRDGDHWPCVCSTSIALLGLTSYLSSAHEMQPNFDARLTINGNLIRSVHFGPESIGTPDLVIDVPAAQLAGANSVIIQKTGAGRLYYSLELRQCLQQPRPTESPGFWMRVIGHIRHTYPPHIAPAPSGYRIRRVYLRLTSRRNFFWEDTVPAPESRFNKDDDILVRLIIDCTRPASRVMVEEPIPAGCRVLDTSSDEQEDWSSWWDYTDVRDDRVLFFVKDMTTGEHEIDYHLQAQTAGAYDVMPPALTSMEDPTLNALGAPGHIAISGGGS